MESVKSVFLGRISYEEAYRFQRNLFDRLVEDKKKGVGRLKGTLVFCEHKPVITIGRHGLNANVLVSDAVLKEKGVEVIHTDRGGDVTFHGIGQLVVYPVLDLEKFGMGVKKYIYTLEETVIRLLEKYRIHAARLEGAPGVWLDVDLPEKTRKICAIGVRCHNYVTMHGLALNVSTDLDYFNLINPCGFKDKSVTSIEKEIGEKLPFNKVIDDFSEIFFTLFDPFLKQEEEIL